jgi:tetratricopeptide (TPR) repeat protein
MIFLHTLLKGVASFYLWLFLLALPSYASDVGGDIELAVTLYKKGYEHFQQQRYPDALSAFLRSREALPRTRRYQRARNELLYYIGVCYMEIGSDRKARQFLKDYQAATPRKRDKDKDVHARLATLEKRLAIPKPPPPPVRRVIIRRPPPPPPPPSPHIGGWITFGVGGGVLIGGLIVAILAQQKMDETTQRYDQQKQSGSRIAQEVALNFRSAQERATTANILYAVGGAAVLAGVVLLFTWKNPPNPSSNPPQPPPTTPNTSAFTTPPLSPSTLHPCKNQQQLCIFAAGL